MVKRKPDESYEPPRRRVQNTEVEGGIEVKTNRNSYVRVFWFSQQEKHTLRVIGIVEISQSQTIQIPIDSIIHNPSKIYCQ